MKQAVEYKIKYRLILDDLRLTKTDMNFPVLWLKASKIVTEQERK